MSTISEPYKDAGPTPAKVEITLALDKDFAAHLIHPPRLQAASQ